MKCPKALRKMVWLTYIGEKWNSKCTIKWCNNNINILGTWHVGHDIPKSKGGTFDINNLRPICSECNSGMGDRYTIMEWNNMISNYYTPKEIEVANIMVEFYDSFSFNC